MNKKIKTIILFICILLLIIVISRTFYIIRANKVLASEDKQVEVLSQIYEYFLKNYDNCNITLDESAFKNLKTNEKFSDEHIEKLKKFERTVKDQEQNYTLCVSTDPYISYVNLRIVDNSNRAWQQHFYLTPGLTKIKFRPDKLITVSN